MIQANTCRQSQTGKGLRKKQKKRDEKIIGISSEKEVSFREEGSVSVTKVTCRELMTTF